MATCWNGEAQRAEISFVRLLHHTRQEEPHQSRVPLPARPPPQLRNRIRGRHGAAVRPVASHRVIRVADRNDHGGLRYVRAGKAVGVAGSVKPLMVVLDDRYDIARRPQLARDLDADRDVPAHQLDLAPAERTRLEEHRVLHPDLADVVHDPAEVDRVERDLRNPRRFAQCSAPRATRST